VAIYLEGGGACFNDASCKLLTFDLPSYLLGGGIFNFSRSDNPIRDWNVFYIPYCTGDVHAGIATGMNVPGGPTNQSFVGYANIGHYLKRIIPTFPDLKKVLLTGISAGGFGAAYNYDRVAQAFCPTPVILIDDSGPPMSDSYIAPCLQDRWKTLWNLKTTLPSECPECSGPDGGGIVNYISYLQNRYPQSRLGLISSTHDSVISLFFGYGKNDCKDIDGIASSVAGDVYAAGLAELRDKYATAPGVWATYYVDSTTHTYLLAGLYSTTVNGKKLSDWVDNVVNDGPMEHVAP